jgi:hypothetical protein
MAALMGLSACNPFAAGERDYQEVISLRDAFEANPSDRSPVDALIGRTSSRNELTRGNAVAVLGQLTLDRKLRPKIIQSTLPIFIRALNDRDQSVRHSAIDALSGLGQSASSALPALKTLLTDGDSFIQEIAQDAIRDIQSENP